MSHALALPGANSLLTAYPKLTSRNGSYTYTIETRDGQSTYSVTDGTNTLTLPIRWSFGAKAQTWVLEHDGRMYESLVSYYPAISGLAVTTGDDKLIPRTLEEAIGRELTQSETKSCFGCHTTDALKEGKLNLESLKPGVTCEHCHAGAGTHLADASLGNFNSPPPSLGKLSSEEIANFCGQCHRSWSLVVRLRWRGETNVRFQPYRLTNSKCFDGADPRISCVACHNPHQNVVREESFYDAKCVACHSSTAHVVSTTSPKNTKSCPVAKSNCISCHMPQVELPRSGNHLTFTDHQIRVVKAGELYPN